MERDFKGIWIPKEIWLNDDLTLQEKVFLVEIDSLDNEEGCFATNKYFSEFFKISTTRVSLVINSLIDKGYLSSTIIYKEGTKQILKRVLKICYRGYLTNVKEGYLTNVKDPIQQKLKDNNTINNTNNNNTINNNKKKKKETEYDLIINQYTDDLELKGTIYEFIKMRKAIKKPMTSNALSLILKRLDKLSNNNDNAKVKILENSIINSWQGIFELKNDPPKKKSFIENMKELYEEVKWADEQAGVSAADDCAW